MVDLGHLSSSISPKATSDIDLDAKTLIQMKFKTVAEGSAARVQEGNQHQYLLHPLRFTATYYNCNFDASTRT